MVDTPTQQVIVLKKQHAQRVVDKLEELKTVINDQPDLWFGGLPPIFVQAQQNAEFQSNQIQQIFSLEGASENN